MKQKIIAILILILVVGGLVLLTIFFKNKTTSETGSEKTGIALFTKKNPGTRDVKNQGNIGNQNNGNDFTGNDTTKPISIIENVINTITGNTGSSNTQNTDTTNSVSIENKTIGQAIRDFFLGNDGLPTDSSTTQQGGENSELVNSNSGYTSETIPGIDVPIEIINNGDTAPIRPECSPAVYVSKLTRKRDLELQLRLGIKTATDLTDEEQELQKWKPTKAEEDEDDMKRVLHRYWDIWSYPDNYLKPEENGDCGTWTNPTTTDSNLFKDSTIAVNETTINNAKREVRKSFSALGTIMSSTFSVSQSEGQRLIAQNDNLRYNDMLNDCRVIRAQFEGGFAYDKNGNRLEILQYYYPNSQLGTATVRDSTTTATTDEDIKNAQQVLLDSVSTHTNIAKDLARRVKLNSGVDALGNKIRSEIIKNQLLNWKDDVNILTKTTIGNISYLWDADNPVYDFTINFPKNKSENMSVFDGSLATGVSMNFPNGTRANNSEIEARYYLTKWPKIQYGGSTGTQQIRGSTFWSSSQNAINYNPGLYVIREPQSIWEMLQQDKNKVLYCRLNKFMGQWAGIETNSHPAQYINSHGINCDNAVTLSPDVLQKAIDDIKGTERKVDNKMVYLYAGFTANLKEIIESSVGQIGFNLFESPSIMTQFVGINRDNWYSNSVQNAVFEFIKDED